MTARLAALLGVGLAIAASGAGAQDLLIAGARLVDGTGRPPRDGVDLLVRDGRIAAIGSDLRAPDAPRLDVRGAWVLPGLIDTHVHLGWGPGAALREPRDPEQWRSFLAHYLRAYLAVGVTTVFDPGAPEAAVRDIRRRLGEGQPGPRYLTTGPLLRPRDGYPEGYPEEWWITVGSPEDVEAAFARIASLGGVGIKITHEQGWNPIGKLPRFPVAVREAIAQAARRRELPIYVHATSEEDQRAALDLGARAIVHPILYRDSDLSDEFIARMAESGAYQGTTLIAYAAPSTEDLQDPLFRLVVPPVELAAAGDRDAVLAGFDAQIAANTPWVPGFLRGIAARWFLGEDRQREALERSQRALRRLHEAGVPIVLGSDTATNPWSVYALHGVSTLREIELLRRAGLTPEAVLAAATRVPAEMLGLAAEIGTIEVGKAADLVILRDDPRRDLRALRGVLWTVRGGVARTPSEWMEVERLDHSTSSRRRACAANCSGSSAGPGAASPSWCIQKSGRGGATSAQIASDAYSR